MSTQFSTEIDSLLAIFFGVNYSLGVDVSVGFCIWTATPMVYFPHHFEKREKAIKEPKLGQNSLARLGQQEVVIGDFFRWAPQQQQQSLIMCHTLLY